MNIEAHQFVHEAAHSKYPVKNIKVTYTLGYFIIGRTIILNAMCEIN
jgi:hypothetical protein